MGDHTTCGAHTQFTLPSFSTRLKLIRHAWPGRGDAATGACIKLSVCAKAISTHHCDFEVGLLT